MASSPQPTNPTPPESGTLAELAKRHKETGFVLIALGVLWAILPIYLAVKEAYVPKGSWTHALGPVFFWAVWCSLTTIIIGVGAVLAAPGRKLGQVETLRLLFLILGGIIGILTAVLGLSLPFTAAYAPIFTGGVEAWRKQPLRLYIVALALVGGLGLTFLSLQLSRGVEREKRLDAPAALRLQRRFHDAAARRRAAAYKPFALRPQAKPLRLCNADFRRHL